MGVDGALRVGSRAYAFWICNLGGDSKRDRGVLAGGCLGLGSHRAKPARWNFATRGCIDMYRTASRWFKSGRARLLMLGGPGQI